MMTICCKNQKAAHKCAAFGRLILSHQPPYNNFSKLLVIPTSKAVTVTSVYSPLPESILTPSGDHRRGLIIVSSKISFAEIRLTARAQMRKRREFCLTEGLRRKLLLKSLFYNRYPSNSLFCLDELCCYCDFSDTIYCVEYFSMQTAGKLTCVSHSYIR